jgi:hypothetical protein
LNFEGAAPSPFVAIQKIEIFRFTIGFNSGEGVCFGPTPQQLS